MRRRFSGWCGVLLLIAAGGVGAQNTAVADLAAARAAELATSADARQRYAGLMIADMGRWQADKNWDAVRPGSLAHPDAAAWSALWRGSDDPLILTHIARCSPVGGTSCEESAEALARLLELEPDNLAHWMLAIGLARAEGDDAALAAAYAGAAASTRYDPRDGDFLRLLSAGWKPIALHPSQRAELRLLGLPEEAGGLIAALGVWLAIAMPALQPITDACIAAAQPTLLDRDQCRNIARLMHTSPASSEIMVRIGLRIAFEHSDDAATKAALEAEWAASEWRMAKLTETTTRARWPYGDPVVNRALWRAWQQEPGEVAVNRAALLTLGKPLQPPADWRPQHTLAERAAVSAARRVVAEPTTM